MQTILFISISSLQDSILAYKSSIRIYKTRFWLINRASETQFSCSDFVRCGIFFHVATTWKSSLYDLIYNPYKHQTRTQTQKNLEKKKKKKKKNRERRTEARPCTPCVTQARQRGARRPRPIDLGSTRPTQAAHDLGSSLMFWVILYFYFFFSDMFWAGRLSYLI